MDLAFAAAEGSAAPTAAQVSELKELLRKEGPALPSRILARYNARLANIERRAAAPPPAFAFVLPSQPKPAEPTTTTAAPPPARPSPPSPIVLLEPREGVIEIRDKSGETIHVSASTKPVALHLQNLSHCQLHLTFPIASLSASSLRHCTISVPSVRGSGFIDDAHSCVLAIGAAQIRLRAVHSSTLSAIASSPPLLESSTDILLSRSPLLSASIPHDPQLDASELALRKEWLTAEDMTWARPGPSPNWRANPNPGTAHS